jgi:hypothetical protein
VLCKFMGVRKKRFNKDYTASICLGKRTMYLGTFKTDLEAARAYDVMAKKHGKRTNFND